jgi:transglutaminase-like putative cysteine protease
MSAAAPAVPTFAPLDVRNVLWLLGAMAFVVAPHVSRIPYWIGIFCAIVVAWRAWIAWAAWHFPKRWFMVILTIASTVGIWLTFRSLFGREAGVALLIVMSALKLLEMRTQREVTLSIYLGFFLVLTSFLFNQSIPLGIYMLICVWIFVATMVGFNRVGRSPTLGERLRPAAALVIQALPLMAAFFLLFPRVQGPLWALPRDTAVARTGLSDTMSPGQISNLIKSDEVAFRVQFDRDMPPYGLLYFRGPVLTEFDGRTWKMPENSVALTQLVYSRHERPTRYTITLEPHQKTWLFALDVPAEVPQVQTRANVLYDLQIHNLVPVSQRMRYEMTSWLDYRYGERTSPSLLRYSLRLDETRNPRAVALGREFAAGSPDPRAVIARAMQYFSRQFTYTLEPPTLDTQNPYDDFLFNTQRGFCEHFAGAFTILMRAAGVPARVVTGYQGGEVNPLNNELIVRQADAHAWSEVWIAGEGWVRVDPTAAVSPTRVEGGVNAALGPIGVIPSLIAADQFGLLAQVGFAWQLVNSNWNQWVIGYNPERQRQFFQNLGIPRVDWSTLAIWLVLITSSVAVAIYFGLFVRDRPPRPDAALQAWDRYCAKLASTGVTRAPHEGPLDFLARVKSMKPQMASEAEEITRRYIEARYGAGASKSELKELLRRISELRAA